MADSLPALSLVAVPGKRNAALEAAGEADRRNFAGIACPSLGGALALCVSLAHLTKSIPFWTSIQPIYLATPAETASTASHLAEVSGGRFRLGLGVSHGPVHERLGIDVGRPLSDTRDYVAAVRKAGGGGPFPPIILATLRDKMLALAAEISEGAVWANASLSHMGAQVAQIPKEKQDAGFFIGNMVPTVIDDDRAAARAVHRKTLRGYVSLPNYRNYWKAAGYVEEMEAIEKALAADPSSLTEHMSDRWLDDCTLSGSPSQGFREGVEAWYAAGVTPIVTMSSTGGGQMKAISELFDLYS